MTFTGDMIACIQFELISEDFRQVVHIYAIWKRYTNKITVAWVITKQANEVLNFNRSSFLNVNVGQLKTDEET